MVFCRRKTPHASPQPCNLPAAEDLSADEHCLRPAGSITSNDPSDAPAPAQGGNSLQDVDANATSRSHVSLETRPAGHEETEVLNCSSPESRQDAKSTDSLDTCNLAAQHREAAAHSQRRGLFGSLKAPADKEERAFTLSQMQMLETRQQTPAGDDAERSRPRQNARRGRGGAVQELPMSRMPVTLDSNRFGFVKLPAARYANSPSIYTEPVSDVIAQLVPASFCPQLLS